MKFQPKISIIIPVYNGENYLRESIESAINQTYKNIEIIVVNDGSNDDNKTENIALSYGSKVKYIKKKNGGVASALNLGIEKMTGDYFSWLSHDDLYTPNKIKNQVDILEKIEDKETLICCRHCVVDKDLHYLYENSFEGEQGKVVYPALKCLFKGYIHGCGLLIHKSHFDRVGNFNESLPTTQDYDLWFRMLRKQKVYLNEQCDVISRSHEEQGSKKFLKSHIKECDKLWINIVDTLTKQEKIEISGSEYKFYKEIYEFLNTYTQYEECIIYIYKLYVQSLKKEIQENKLNIKEVFSIIRSENLQNILLERKTKQRIVFGDYGDWSDKGGLNRMVASIANALTEFYDVYVIANGSKDSGYELSNKVRYIDTAIEKIHSGDLQELSTLMLAIEADVHIGVHNCSNYLLKIYKELKKYQIKNIAWNHEFYFIPYWNMNFSSVLKERISTFKEIEAVFWLTSFNEKIWCNIADNGIVMQNPISWKKPENIRYEKKEKNIVSIARFNDTRKCLDKLIKVFALVQKQEPEANLYVIGQYDLDMKCNDEDITIRELIKQQKIPKEKIIFTGFIDNSIEILKKSKVNVVTSYHEGFGLIINETGMYKIPSVACNDSGFEDLINENYNGFLVSRKNDQEMADKILKLLQNDELCKKMGENAYNKCDEYLPEKVTKKWKLVLDKILNTNNQEELNNFYKENCPPIEVYDKNFISNLINQYEVSIQRILKTSHPEIIKVSNDEEIQILLNKEQELRDKLNDINESTSWKITKPVRVISAYVKTGTRKALGLFTKGKEE